MSHLWRFVGACSCLVLLMLDVCGLLLVVLLKWAGVAGVGWGRCNGRVTGSEVRSGPGVGCWVCLGQRLAAGWTQADDGRRGEGGERREWGRRGTPTIRDEQRERERERERER